MNSKLNTIHTGENEIVTLRTLVEEGLASGEAMPLTKEMFDEMRSKITNCPSSRIR
jgi:hypothetical protein